MHRKSVVITFILVALGTGFIGGFLFGKEDRPLDRILETLDSDRTEPEGADFTILWQAWNKLHREFVDRESINDDELILGAVDGLVSAIGDPYTVFLPPKQTEVLIEQIKGSFAGVGMEIGLRSGLLTIIAPIKDSPAFRAGLLAGDRIIAIDGESTIETSVEKAVQLIRGEIGTQVMLTIARAETDNFNISIIRDEIKIPAMVLEIDENIAHMQLFTFNQQLVPAFEQAVAQIQAAGVEGVILDVRNNPGGLLDSAIEISSYFLEAGDIVTTQKDAAGSEIHYRAKGRSELIDMPVIVLTNGGSASASEIVAGALRDNRGTIIMGEKTFGKGSVQDIFDLKGNSTVKITVAKWFTPSGISISDTGIEPTIVVSLSEDQTVDVQYDEALSLIKSLI